MESKKRVNALKELQFTEMPMDRANIELMIERKVMARLEKVERSIEEAREIIKKIEEYLKNENKD